ncbi:hypothetical protein MERGE_000414 [Pneumocystis wakefieldiae]|uniref:DNA-directed RNA polymerases I, II, and III subunit RPABC3 n=1 Tax=Pneumocystis wakefieldiae TaxID=38082 RepID=A0A899FYP7_9ASCO|nr:hypothetical protein MERGE_000414 [Pneumocystis wakefieldiae]
MSTEMVLIDEIFHINTVDSQKFDRVSRITAISSSQDMELTLDINSELYPLKPNESISVQVASTLHDSFKDSADYIMYGKVYRFDEGEKDLVSVYISFGGLLMCLEGPYKKLSRLSILKSFLFYEKMQNRRILLGLLPCIKGLSMLFNISYQYLLKATFLN